MNHTKVLIIGAGPVGLTLACELARRNVPFRIIERAATASQGSRAKALQPRSLEILNDLGIVEQLMEIGITELPYRKFIGNQLMGETPRTGFPRTDTRYPKTLLLPQPAVESALRTRLEELGGKVEWATELIDFTQTDEGIICRLEHPNWSEELNAIYMVACDGGKSTTRKKLGIQFLGETHQEEQLWVGDVEVDGLKPDAWYNWLSPVYGIAMALFPFKNSNKWQLQAVVPPDENGNVPTPTLEGFNELFKERTQMEGVTFTNSTWQSIYRVNVRRAATYRVGNAFIAGDAAHVHSIAGGMGMNTGIQDAYNLSWKLAAVINGEANDQLLNTYDEERIPIADWLLETTSQRQKVMMAGATSGKSGFESLGTADTTQLNLNYRGSSLNVGNIVTLTGLQAGDRAPDVQLSDGRWLSEQLRGTEWKLLVFNTKAQSNERIKILSVEETVQLAYGVGSGAVLIRPDGYIALIGQANEINNYLKNL
ncbi:3-(3-hydroxyphenyl)propionate hydroxylase [Mucilaginibacter corticis]|uniref:3-(3-hydroxyphenyl)propionate hydroxylase n=1 Tax=Mucilaginibacter corticis TaxID=2597670 RepID=A0A556MM11_9SPHI|nr:FAD-dependent monooxygenase [Mucilaginibacter corticis]TSJ40895.1 3-(3-hydroxyphenyl)propionate hydroxylase [Mucilaginibacter corticis]